MRPSTLISADFNDTPLVTMNESERTSMVTTLMFRGNLRSASKSLTHVLQTLEFFVQPNRPSNTRRRTLEDREITSVPERMDEVFRRLSPFVVLENVGRGATGFKRPTLLWGKRSRTHAIRILVDAVIRRAKQTGEPLRNALLSEILDVLLNKDCNSTKRYNSLLLEVKANRMYVQATGGSSDSSSPKDRDFLSSIEDSDTSKDALAGDFDLSVDDLDSSSDALKAPQTSSVDTLNIHENISPQEHVLFDDDETDVDFTSDDDTLVREEIEPLRELFEQEDISVEDRDDINLLSGQQISSDSFVVYRYE